MLCFLRSRLIQWRRGGGRQRQHGKRQQTGQRLPSTRRLCSLLAGAVWRPGGGCGEGRSRARGAEHGILWGRQHEDHDTKESPDERPGETQPTWSELLVPNEQMKQTCIFFFLSNCSLEISLQSSFHRGRRSPKSCLVSVPASYWSVGVWE